MKCVIATLGNIVSWLEFLQKGISTEMWERPLCEDKKHTGTCHMKMGAEIGVMKLYTGACPGLLRSQEEVGSGPWRLSTPEHCVSNFQNC